MQLLKIYIHRQVSRIRHEQTKGFNLFIATCGSICYFFMHLLSFSLVISKFSFPGWSTAQIWTLFFVFELYTYLCFHFFWRGLINTKQNIIDGKFDYYLTKPVNTPILSLIQEGSVNNFACVFLSVVYLAKTLVENEISVSVLSLILFAAVFVISLLQFYFVSASAITLNIFFGAVHGSVGAAFNFQESWKYPAEAFRSRLFAALFVYPFALVTTIPAILILTKNLPQIHLLTYALTTIVFYVVYRMSWSLGLRHYSSASS